MNAPTYQGYGPPQNGQPAHQGYGPPQGQPQYQQGPPPAQNGGQPLGSPVQQAGEDASGFFNGASGAPSLSFPQDETGIWKGGIFTGTIATKQATTMKTATKPSTPRFWDSGDEVKDVIVELLTQDRDANNPLDDGRRRMYVTQEDTHIADSKASVTKEATKGGFHRGGKIYWCRTGYRQGTQLRRGVWACSYEPPTAETLAILDNLPPQGVSQAGAQSVQQGQPQQQGPFVAPPAVQQGPPQYQQAPAQQSYGPPPQQMPQTGPNNYTPNGQWQGQQSQPGGQQYPQTPAAQQGYGPPEQGPPGTAWNGQQGPPAQQQPQYDPAGSQAVPPSQWGPNGGPPPQQQGYQQGAPAQTGNPYAQYQQ